MERSIIFVMIAMIILGMLAGCKSNDDALSGVTGSLGGNVTVGDKETAGNQQNVTANNHKDNSGNAQQPEEQEPNTSEPTPEVNGQQPQEGEEDPAPEQGQEGEEQEGEEPKEEEQPVGEGGGPLFEASENPYKSSLKILAIGNSFSVDAMEYLWDVAKAYGAKEVILGNLYIGGCSLDTHYENMMQNAPAYTYYKNDSGTWNKTSGTSILTALYDEKWDIITVQQASDKNADPEDFASLKGILPYLEQKKPTKDTKILWHMIWAYQSDSTKPAFAEYGKSQIKMYETIVKRVKEDVLFYDNFAGVIPVGTAIQNLRTTIVGDTLTRDGYHLSLGLGRYVAALTWYCYITGTDPQDAQFAPAKYQADIYPYLDEINRSVSDAIRNPYEVTK